MTSFEKYLEKICFTIYPSVLDDDMPNFFDAWLGGLDGEDLIRYGNLYGGATFFEGREATLQALEK